MSFLESILQKYNSLHWAGRSGKQLPWQSKSAEGVIAKKWDLTLMESDHALMGVARGLL